MKASPLDPAAMDGLFHFRDRKEILFQRMREIAESAYEAAVDEKNEEAVNFLKGIITEYDQLDCEMASIDTYLRTAVEKTRGKKA